MREQNLSIKLEIDSVPPAGAISQTGIINRHALLSLRYYDLPSLMAGKVHALITRKYPKGRDWYDLVWYRAKRPPISPNLEQLQNALNQTQGKNAVDAAEWQSQLKDRVRVLDFRSLIEDVRNFLEDPKDSLLLTRHSVGSILE